MRIRKLFFPLLMCLGFASSGQSPRIIIDSLLQRVDTMDIKPKVKAYTEIAANYQFLPNGFDSLTYYAQVALDISEDHNFKTGKQTAYYYLAMAAWYGKEDFELSKEYFLKTRALVFELKNFRKLAPVNNAIGTIYMMQGRYEKAITILQEAYESALEFEDYATLGIISTNLGIIYNNTNDTLNAIKINESALEHLAKSNTPQSDITTVGVYHNLIGIYLNTNQLDKVEHLIKKARIKVDSMQMFRLDARLAVIEAQFLEKKGLHDELYAYVNEKLPQIETNQGFDREMYTSLLIFKGKGLVAEGKISETKEVINKLKTHLGISNVLHERNLLKDIYVLSELVGEYKDAFIYLDKYKVLNDSILSADQKEKILTLERKYQLEKKDQEIEKNQIENLELKRKNGMLFIGILGLVIIGLLTYLWYFKKRQKEIAKINQIEQKMLSLQMNPHFIFNAISSIQNYLFDEGDSKKAIHHLSTFATLMRQMLENSREKFIPLEEEIEFLKNYLNLQKLRFDDKFQYHINVSEEIDPGTVSIPPLLTQPFIENAIDHGKIYLVENGILKINIFRRQGDLLIQIVDNGMGVNNTNNENDNDNKPLIIKKKSLSIAITSERLQLLSKLMKKKFYLEIKPNETGNGTTVNLNVPAIPSD